MNNLKPVMGWNTWNTFGEKINEELIMQATDALIETGLKDAGYEYIIVDDCWSIKGRDENGRLVADPVKFPHGMKYLADYIHSKGLKFGMYSCCGTMTCALYPGSYNHEYVDAATLAEWEVDYLKYDYCMQPKCADGQLLFRRMGLALANCGRDIHFAACTWGEDETHKWIGSTGANTWRSTGDIFDSWESVKRLIQLQYDILPFGGQGCFNDMDMLIVGMCGNGNVGLGGCTWNEYKLHFAAWCLLQSPLIIGCDIRNLRPEAKEILTNKELISILLDARCNRPYIVKKVNFDDNFPVIVRVLDNGDVAVGFFNLGDDAANMWVALDDIGIPSLQGKTVEGKEVYTGEEACVTNETLLKCVEAHGCAVYRLKIADNTRI
ncbi:MAG: glycoside hydrolase family 27 protein [bacterium]|nr:glycoside hydrolase family 27 protein [bacterium]